MLCDRSFPNPLEYIVVTSLNNILIMADMYSQLCCQNLITIKELHVASVSYSVTFSSENNKGSFLDKEALFILPLSPNKNNTYKR